jgi:hypothetical protein
VDNKTFRDNLFAMNTRRFGKVMEVAVQALTDSYYPSNIHYDLITTEGTRIEVKFSRVEKKHADAVKADNVLELIENEGIPVRMFPYTEYKNQDFVCNIQQLKKKEFDVLVYGLLFADRILFFLATPEDIGPNMSYCDRQHKGNKGEGQFHIKPSNLQYHIDNHLLAALSYGDLMLLLDKAA